jgi:DNA polymerase III alpha subunit (gram-positive type)
MLEKKVKKGTISYWKDGVMELKQCTKCKEIKLVERFNRRGNGYVSKCKECEKQYRKDNEEHYKQYYKDNKEHISEYGKQYYKDNIERVKERHRRYEEEHKEELKAYRKQYYKENAERHKESCKRWEENNKEHRKECSKQYYQNNKEYYREYHKQYAKNNTDKIKEYHKQHYETNKEHIKERTKQYLQRNKENNLQVVSNMIEQINPIMKNLPIYGYIYKFENIKTGHIYIGQSTIPFKRRYSGGIKGWIKERKEYANQQFIEELTNEEDFEVEEVFDIGISKWHLDKLESFYINKFNSCDNGYNNKEGNHSTNDGLEEFEQILKENGLQFIDGKLIAI